MIEVECPKCGKRHSVYDAAAGKRAKCGQCGNVVIVPAMSAVVAKSATPASRSLATVDDAAPMSSALVPRPLVGRIVPAWERVTAVVGRGRELAKSLRRRTVISVSVSTPPAVVAPPQVPVAAMPAPATKACPFCGEQVLVEARKCRHCHETIDVALRAAEEAKRMAVLTARPTAAAPTVNVVNQNTAVAHSQAVYATPATNGLASLSLLVGLAAIGMAFYPPTAQYAFLAAPIRGLLAAFGFVAALLKGGTGLLTAIVGGLFSIAALVIASPVISGMK